MEAEYYSSSSIFCNMMQTTVLFMISVVFMFCLKYSKSISVVLYYRKKLLIVQA